MATTTPAIELVGAILRQVLTDLPDHHTGHMRQEARAFILGSGAEGWDETLGMSGYYHRRKSGSCSLSVIADYLVSVAHASSRR